MSAEHPKSPIRSEMEPVSENTLRDEEVERLKQGTSHLSFSTVTSMFEKLRFEHGVDSMVEYCKDKVEPDFIGELSTQIVAASCVDSKGLLSEPQCSKMINEGPKIFEKFFKKNQARLPPLNAPKYLKRCSSKEEDHLKLVYEQFVAQYPECIEKEEEKQVKINPDEDSQGAIESDEVTPAASTSRSKRCNSMTKYHSPEPPAKRSCEISTEAERNEQISEKSPELIEKQEWSAETVLDEQPSNPIETEETTHTPSTSDRRPKRITSQTKFYTPEVAKKRARESVADPTRSSLDDSPSTSGGIRRRWRRPRESDHARAETGLDVAHGCLIRSPYNDGPSRSDLDMIRRRGRIVNGSYVGQKLFVDSENDKDDIDTTVLEDMKGFMLRRHAPVMKTVAMKTETDTPETSTALAAEEVQSAGREETEQVEKPPSAETISVDDVPRESSTAPEENVVRRSVSIVGGSETSGGETPNMATLSRRNTETPDE